jgi:hypothetical protein
LAVGHPDQFAKRAFASDTELVTHGAVVWVDPPEISLVKVQGDGLLSVRAPESLALLPAPWRYGQGHGEILVEIKMPGDHLDRAMLERTLLRRQARQVQRIEDPLSPWQGEEPLWIVAPHVPQMLSAIRDVRRIAPGCYAVEPSPFPFVWVAANELPLREALIPFLVARSGRALDEFGRWVALRRPVAWVLDMVEYTTMSMPVREEVLRAITQSDDPEIRERQRHIFHVLLKAHPDLQQQLVAKSHEDGLETGRLIATRSALRRVLARRKLPVNAQQDAQIEACTEIAALERWLDAAAVATSSAEALR